MTPLSLLTFNWVLYNISLDPSHRPCRPSTIHSRNSPNLPMSKTTMVNSWLINKRSLKPLKHSAKQLNWMPRTHSPTSTRPCLCTKPWVMLLKLPTFAKRHWNVSIYIWKPRILVISSDTRIFLWYLVDPACDAAVASLAQILLELGKAEEALGYYEMAIGLARTQPELEHAISYVEATKAQIR